MKKLNQKELFYLSIAFFLVGLFFFFETKEEFDKKKNELNEYKILAKEFEEKRSIYTNKEEIIVAIEKLSQQTNTKHSLIKDEGRTLSFEVTFDSPHAMELFLGGAFYGKFPITLLKITKNSLHMELTIL